MLIFLHVININPFWNSIWPIDGMLIGTTTLSQSEPGSNANEGVHTPRLKLHHQV